MRQVVLRRLAAIPVVLVLVSVFVFALPVISGVDVARATLSARVAEASPDEETLQRIRQELALDRSVPAQYLAFTSRAIRGDFGLSYASRRPVGATVARALSVSGVLSGSAMLLAVLGAVPLGLFCASRRNTWFDRLICLVNRSSVAVPIHVLGPLLILVFGVQLRVLPTGGWTTPAHMVLPTLTMAVIPTALLAQLVRSETIAALQQQFITTAKAKGLPPVRVLWHACRVSLTGALAVGSTFLAGLLGGSVVTEVVFTISGMGSLLFDAVTNLDIPVLQGGMFITLLAGLLVGVTSDVVAVMVDPRIRYR